MILQSLGTHYTRERAAGRVPPIGYERKAIDLVLDLAADGSVLAATTSSKLHERPQAVVSRWPARSGKLTGDDIKCAYLVDKADYVLGFDEEKARRWAAYHRQHLAGTKDAGLQALLRFLDVPNRGLNLDALNGSMTVAMMYEGSWLHERDAAMAIWDDIRPRSAKVGRCLVSGGEEPLADLHPRVTVGGNMAALISYNEDALGHYGHEGGGNSPISEVAAHGYIAALDSLVARKCCAVMGDSVATYWTELEDQGAAQTAESLLAAILGGTAGPDAAAEAAKVRDAIAQLARGKAVTGVLPETPYCILAIEPGTGRHAVRTFLRSTMGALARSVAAHQEALDVGTGANPSIRDIARATIRADMDAKPSPSLVNDLMRSVLTGARYPTALANGVLTRLRAGDAIDSLRAGILKAHIIRNAKEVLTVTCDPNHPSPAYHLGRLLAAVEAVQLASMPGNSVTVRERYYRMLSTRPAVAMAGMMGGLTHHLATLRRAGKGGLSVILDREVQEVAGKITSVPSALSIADQSLMAVGYYQQRAAQDAARAARKAETSNTGNSTDTISKE